MNELKKIRTLKEFNQFQVAIVSGVSQSRISLIENGYVQPRDDEKAKLAKVLKTPVKTLFPALAKGKTLLTEGKGR